MNDFTRNEFGRAFMEYVVVRWMLLCSVNLASHCQGNRVGSYRTWSICHFNLVYLNIISFLNLKFIWIVKNFNKLWHGKEKVM